MTDTELLDFIEESIFERAGDLRWNPNYMCHLGTISFSIGANQTRTFRELVKQARIDQIKARLKNNP